MILSCLAIISILFVLLFLMGVLKINHQIIFVDGVDMELERDYQALMEQSRK